MNSETVNISKVVLVVEDERPLALAICTKLENNGFDVVTARTAKQALDYLSEIPRVDLIWLDHYLLGKETGLDLVAQVKQDGDRRKIPIFVVSNTASAEKVQTYLQFGVERYYVKSDHRLDEIIQDILGTITNGDGKK